MVFLTQFSPRGPCLHPAAVAEAREGAPDRHGAGRRLRDRRVCHPWGPMARPTPQSVGSWLTSWVIWLGVKNWVGGSPHPPRLFLKHGFNYSFCTYTSPPCRWPPPVLPKYGSPLEVPPLLIPRGSTKGVVRPLAVGPPLAVVSRPVCMDLAPQTNRGAAHLAAKDRPPWTVRYTGVSQLAKWDGAHCVRDVCFNPFTW